MTKSELKNAQDELEISGEIYKASLETITQLEVDSKRKSGSRGEVDPQAAPVTLPSLADLTSSVSGTGDSTKDSAVSAKEHQRVVNLCTTFQEQCLWRSIELTESEKRSLALEGQLRQALDAHAGCQEHLESCEASILALEAEVKKLKAHKSILVQEVKKLQPFSQVNLSALVQEAQEARMMQRSLQAQLDASQAAVRSMGSSSTTTIVTNGPTVGSPTQSGGVSDEDGAGGGFVVIESEDDDRVEDAPEPSST